MCDLFYLAVIQTRYRQKWNLRLLCKSPIISIKMRFTLWSAIWFVSLIGWTVYFRNRSLPIFKMCRSARKKSQHIWFRKIISWKVLERSLFACCDASNNERVSSANEWVFDASQLVNKDRSCALCEIFPLNASWGDTLLQWGVILFLIYCLLVESWKY